MGHYSQFGPGLHLVAEKPGKPWALSGDGVIVTVRLTPKGGRDLIDGIEYLADGRPVLKVRVRAAPSDGEANDALERLIARTVGVAPRQVVLIGGATSRIKRVQILGDPPSITTALASLGEPLAR